MFDDIIFPGVSGENWQMMPWERIALTGLLSRMQPKGALEIGVYYGGSLSLTSQYVERIIGIDIDPAVRDRFPKPDNVELWIGPSGDLIPRALESFRSAGMPLNFVLIDADHTEEGVRRDIEAVLHYQPSEPMLIVMHDSGNPDTREGILSAAWDMNPHVHFMECDFVPGQIIEHGIANGRGEIWGGLALAYLDPNPRTGPVSIRQNALTSIRCLHHCAPDLSILG